MCHFLFLSVLFLLELTTALCPEMSSRHFRKADFYQIHGFAFPHFECCLEMGVWTGRSSLLDEWAVYGVNSTNWRYAETRWI